MIDGKKVQQMKTEFETLIARKESFQRNQVDFNGYSSQGGLLYVYYDNGVLQYFTLYLLSERGKTVFNFYPLGNRDVFIIREQNFYEKSIYEGPVNIIEKNEDNFLIKDGIEYDVTTDIKKTDGGNKKLIDIIFNMLGL
jgi:hypothetical protein